MLRLKPILVPILHAAAMAAALGQAPAQEAPEKAAADEARAIERAVAAQIAAAGGAKKELPSTLTGIEAALDHASEEDLPKLLDKAATIDVAAALSFAAVAEQGHGIIAGTWRPADDKIGETMSVALEATQSQYRDHLLLGLVNQWVKTNVEDADRGISSLPEGGLKSMVLDQYHQALLRFRPDAAFANALAGRGLNMRDATLAFARADLKNAIASHAAIPESHAGERAAAAGAIAKVWVAAKPDEAAAWGAALPTPEERLAALEEIAYAWSATDPVAAGRWASALPEGADRDAALQPVVFNTSTQDPAQAFAWALLISDPAARDLSLASATFEWGSHDRTAAAAAIDAAPLTDAQKATLHAALPEAG